MEKIPTHVIYTYEEPATVHSVSYYNRENSSEESNVRVDDLPLVVNCTGRVDLPCKFTTHAKYGRHDFYLMYLTSGELDAVVNDKNEHITPGCAVIFPPEREYTYSKTSKADVQYLWTHFTGSNAESLLAKLGLSGGVYPIGIDENISGMFFQLMEDFILRDDFFIESTAAKLTEILITIRRRLETSTEQPVASVSRIFESIRYIHANYKKNLTNEQLAKIENLSVSQYIELFKRCTGTTPHSYLIELRIRNSCDLLLRSDLSVTQAALAVGYSDAHYFSRIFKSYRGVTPEEFRRGQQK